MNSISDPTLKKIISILQVPQRDAAQNMELAEYLQELEYFQKFKITNTKDLLDIAGVMTYVHIPARTQIFDFGDIGDALYLILDGVVDVVKPLEKTQATSTKSQVCQTVTKKWSEGETRARQALWNRMDLAGHSAVKELEKEISVRRRRSFEKQSSVKLSSKTDYFDGLSATEHKTESGLSQLIKDFNTSYPSSEAAQRQQHQTQQIADLSELSLGKNESILQKEADISQLLTKKSKKKLNKQISLQIEPRQSMYSGQIQGLHEINELKQAHQSKTQNLEKRLSIQLEKQPLCEEDMAPLDSDEERCDLVDDKNAQDRHFFCQKSMIAELRQRIIDSYLQHHAMQQIPQGVSTKSIDIILNLHLYLYHRLPSADKLADLKRAIIKARKEKQEEQKRSKSKDKKDKIDEQVSFVMKFVHCYGRGQSFGGATLLKEGRQAKTRMARTVTVTDCFFIVVSAQNFKHLERFEKRVIEEKIIFLQNLHFFKSWSKNKCKNILFQMPQMEFHKDAVPVKEGSKNDFCYIIISGEFQVRKKIVTQRPSLNKAKEFLQGVSANRSLRGIFNNRIGGLTNNRNLTTDSSLVKEEDIFTLTGGQIFGEERFCEIIAQKQSDARSGANGSKKIDQEKIAPFTIRCISPVAEVFKISNLDLMTILRKDRQTKSAIFSNYKKKRQLLKNKESNMHIDKKFATNLEAFDDSLSQDLEIQSQQSVRSLSPTLSDRQDYQQNDQCTMGELTKLLIKRSFETRDNLREIVQDFPSMRSQAGGEKFDKTIGQQLLGFKTQSLESINGIEQESAHKKLGKQGKIANETIDRKITTESKNLKPQTLDSQNDKNLVNKNVPARPSTQGKSCHPGITILSKSTRQPYINSRVLSAYKAVKKTEAHKMMLANLRQERTLDLNNQAEIDMTKRPIQSSRYDGDKTFDIDKVPPIQMLNVGYESRHKNLTSSWQQGFSLRFSQMGLGANLARSINRDQVNPCYSPQSMQRSMMSQQATQRAEPVISCGIKRSSLNKQEGTRVFSADRANPRNPIKYKMDQDLGLSNNSTTGFWKQNQKRNLFQTAQQIQTLGATSYVTQGQQAMSSDPVEETEAQIISPRNYNASTHVAGFKNYTIDTPNCISRNAVQKKLFSHSQLLSKIENFKSNKNDGNSNADKSKRESQAPQSHNTKAHARVVSCSLNYGQQLRSIAARISSNNTAVRANYPCKYLPVAKTFIQRKKQRRNIS